MKKYNYLLESNDFISINKQIEEIIKKIKFTEIEKNIYDLEEVSLENALEDLDTYSFLSSKKIIIIKNIQLALANENDLTKHLFRYLDQENEDNLLILCTEKLDERKKTTKELKKKTEYIKIVEEPLSMIKSRLKDYELENGVVNLINEYTTGNTSVIDTEVKKLTLYKGDSNKITIQDVKDVCIKRVNNIEQLTFDLVNSIALKNKKRSLEIYLILKENNIEPISLIGLLSNQIRLIYQTKILSMRMLKKDEIAKELEVHPFRVTKALEYMRKFSEEEIEQLIKDLSHVDLKIKKGEIEPVLAFEMFLINL